MMSVIKLVMRLPEHIFPGHSVRVPAMHGPQKIMECFRNRETAQSGCEIRQLTVKTCGAAIGSSMRETRQMHEWIAFCRQST